MMNMTFPVAERQAWHENMLLPDVFFRSCRVQFFRSKPPEQSQLPFDSDECFLHPLMPPWAIEQSGQLLAKNSSTGRFLFSDLAICNALCLQAVFPLEPYSGCCLRSSCLYLAAHARALLANDTLQLATMETPSLRYRAWQRFAAWCVALSSNTHSLRSR